VRVRYRRRAQLDIHNIHDYIASRNARIRSAADRLGSLPFMGHGGRVPGTYEWGVVGLPYIVVYEVDEVIGEVAIIAVFHGRQDRDRGD
jgi:plasmid stabilization system protein ParE